jgi:sugar phosphate isomerase/epimerase
VSDLKDRLPPGQSGGGEDYRSFFAVLREAGYDGMVTVEADTFDIPRDGRRVLDYLNDQWRTA